MFSRKSLLSERLDDAKNVTKFHKNAVCFQTACLRLEPVTSVCKLHEAETVSPSPAIAYTLLDIYNMSIDTSNTSLFLYYTRYPRYIK